MTYASISIDRREAYYERAASLIAKDPLAFYTRAEQGRRVQSGIQRQDLTWDRLRTLGRKLRLVAGVAMARGKA
jgi:hypothetical protein